MGTQDPLCMVSKQWPQSLQEYWLCNYFWETATETLKTTFCSRVTVYTVQWVSSLWVSTERSTNSVKLSLLIMPNHFFFQMFVIICLTMLWKPFITTKKERKLWNVTPEIQSTISKTHLTHLKYEKRVKMGKHNDEVVYVCSTLSIILLRAKYKLLIHY